jgi:hypothetical protein
MTELSPTLSPHRAPVGVQSGWFLTRDQSSRVCFINRTPGVSLRVPSLPEEMTRPLGACIQDQPALRSNLRRARSSCCETTNINGGMLGRLRTDGQA